MSDTTFYRLAMGRESPFLSSSVILIDSFSVPVVTVEAVRTDDTPRVVNPPWPRPPSSRIRIPHNPPPKNAIEPSLFRPHVLASDRLLSWLTPYAVRYRQRLISEVGALDALALMQVQHFSLDEGTRSGYGAGLLRFTQYCDSRRIPEEDRMPASEALLSAFSAVMAAGKRTDDCLDNWLAGLSFWHALNGAPWYGGNSLRITKGGVAKLVPESCRRDKRPPVTIEHLHALRRGLDLSSPFDAAVWAVASVAFWSCCRLGELVIPSKNSFDPRKHVARSTPLVPSNPVGGVESAYFHVPWTKTTSNKGANIIITSRPGDLTDPLSAIKNHLDINSSVPSSAPLFSYVVDDSFSPLSKTAFMERCEMVWHQAGLPLLDGHSFRIGGATELLLLGTPPDVVAVQGRWK